MSFCRAPKTRHFDSYAKLMFACFCLCWIVSPCESQTDVLPVYLQKQQHKVLRVRLERRLGWQRNTREKLRGFSFTLHGWKMEKRSRLGRQNRLFSSTEKSVQYLGSPRRPNRRCWCVGSIFILMQRWENIRGEWKTKKCDRSRVVYWLIHLAVFCQSTI